MIRRLGEGMRGLSWAVMGSNLCIVFKNKENYRITIRKTKDA